MNHNAGFILLNILFSCVSGAECGCEGLPTLLTLIGVPAVVAVAVPDHRLSAKRVVLRDAQANVAALLGLLIPSDVIVELGIHDGGPVYGVKVAELWILLDSDGPTRDVPQVVKPNVFQAGHLKDHQGVVVEEISTPDDSEVGKERAQTVQARHSE